MRVVLIGAGNMATFLGYALQAKDVELIQVFNRNADRARALAEALNTKAIASFDEMDLNADAYLLCVADDAIRPLAENMPKVEGTVIHFSGSQALDSAVAASPNVAVLWPIYSIRKDHLPQQATIPLVIEAINAQALQTVRFLAEKVSTTIIEANHSQRQRLHLSAVLVNNFTNHLMAIAETICAEEKLSFEIFRPIIQQTLAQIAIKQPRDIQTGPAIRGDEATMEAHLHLLKSHPLWQKIYEDMSASIINMYR